LCLLVSFAAERKDLALDQEATMQIFVIGATGYIGGSVAQGLINDGHHVVGLARTEEKAHQLGSRGIEPTLGTLFDSDVIGAAARSVDAIVNAADSDNPYVVSTLLDALRGSGKTLIHTSGSSIVGDRAGGAASELSFDEATRPTPRLEKRGRVAIDEAVLNAAADGIRSIVICPTMVYGPGRGLHRDSVQIPLLVRLAREFQAGVHVGRGENRWSNVHIDDLVELYRVALERGPAGTFLFAENGEASMRDIAAAISRQLGFEGKTISLSISEAIRRVGAEAAEFALASNSRVRARAARALGWRPQHDDLLRRIESGST